MLEFPSMCSGAVPGGGDGDDVEEDLLNAAFSVKSSAVF